MCNAIGINRKRAPRQTHTHASSTSSREQIYLLNMSSRQTTQITIGWKERETKMPGEPICCSWRNNIRIKGERKKRQWKWFTFSHQPPVLLVDMSSVGPSVRETVQFTPKFHTTTNRSGAKKRNLPLAMSALTVPRWSLSFRRDIFAIWLRCICIDFPISPNDESVNLSGAQEDGFLPFQQHSNNNRSDWTRSQRIKKQVDYHFVCQLEQMSSSAVIISDMMMAMKSSKSNPNRLPVGLIFSYGI